MTTTEAINEFFEKIKDIVYGAEEQGLIRGEIEELLANINDTKEDMLKKI